MSQDQIATFSQYLEEKRLKLRITRREFMQLLGLTNGRFSGFIYNERTPTAQEIFSFAERFNDDPIWLLMLCKRLTHEMEEYLFSNYEVFRNIYVRSNNKVKKVA